MGKQEKQMKLRQLMLEKQRRERALRQQTRFIVQSPDGSWYGINSDDNEERKNSYPVTRREIVREIKVNETDESKPLKRTATTSHKSIRGDQEMMEKEERIKLAVIPKNDSKSRTIIEVEDASDDESEDNSDYSHLVPEEGDSWMQPISD